MAESCPVCQAAAERGRDRDYGDKKQFRCPRCGPFEISGTALAMLASRIDHDPLVRARLSHAIRSRASEDNWLFVSSANIDELCQEPLPGVAQQLQNLALWLSARLGDDRLGRVPLPVADGGGDNPTNLLTWVRSRLGVSAPDTGRPVVILFC